MEARTIPAIDVQAAAASDALFLDVREPFEWEAGHIRVARHIPLGDLPHRIDELPAGARIVCVCRSGNRSGRATAWLRANGHEATNMTGGMGAWAAAGLPVVDAAGRPGALV